MVQTVGSVPRPWAMHVVEAFGLGVGVPSRDKGSRRYGGSAHRAHYQGDLPLARKLSV